MKIKLIAFGDKMPSWVNEGFKEYQGRLKAELSLELKELALKKRADERQLKKIREEEDKLILEELKKGSYFVVLDERGKNYSSLELAQRLKFWQDNFSQISLLIGSPEGISPEIKALANESWSLGKLTLPHPIVRIVVAEALYRAWSINKNHPYHRE